MAKRLSAALVFRVAGSGCTGAAEMYAQELGETEETLQSSFDLPVIRASCL